MSVTDPDQTIQNPDVDPITGEPVQQPDAPAQDDPVTAARINEAAANARADAFKEALSMGGKRQDAATTAQVQAPIPTDAMQTFTQSERDELKALQITDPETAMARIAKRSSELERARIQQEAQPLVASQASTLVDLFVMRRSSGSKIADQITPIFRAKLREAGNLSPLVGMTDDVRERELGLRWDAAEAEVLRKAQANPPRQEPTLLAPGQGGGGARQQKKTAVEEDSFLSSMAEAYKFTPEQLKEIEEYAS